MRLLNSLASGGRTNDELAAYDFMEGSLQKIYRLSAAAAIDCIEPIATEPNHTIATR